MFRFHYKGRYSKGETSTSSIHDFNYLFTVIVIEHVGKSEDHNQIVQVEGLRISEWWSWTKTQIKWIPRRLKLTLSKVKKESVICFIDFISIHWQLYKVLKSVQKAYLIKSIDRIREPQSYCEMWSQGRPQLKACYGWGTSCSLGHWGIVAPSKEWISLDASGITRWCTMVMVHWNGTRQDS